MKNAMNRLEIADCISRRSKLRSEYQYTILRVFSFHFISSTNDHLYKLYLIVTKGEIPRVVVVVVINPSSFSLKVPCSIVSISFFRNDSDPTRTVNFRCILLLSSSCPNESVQTIRDLLMIRRNVIRIPNPRVMKATIRLPIPSR